MAANIRACLLLIALVGAGISLFLPVHARAQGASESPTAEAGHTPSGALWRAAVAPGWGQIYNRQYYKLPFVYAGLGGLVASALYNNDRYLTYRRAYLYAINPAEYPQYADEAANFTNIIAAGQASLLRQQRDGFRRNRDLSYIGIGLFYGLTILDAFVNAHLLDFDIDEQLSVRLLHTPQGVRLHAVWQL